MPRRPRIAIFSYDDSSGDQIKQCLKGEDSAFSVERFSSIEQLKAAIEDSPYRWDACIADFKTILPDDISLFTHVLNPNNIASLVIADDLPRLQIVTLLELGVDELIERDTKQRCLQFLPDTLSRIIEHRHESNARREMEITMRKLAEDLTHLKSIEFFQQMTLILTEVLNIDFALVGEISGIRQPRVHTLAACDNGQIVSNFKYPTSNRPSADIVKGEPCVIASGMQEYFPDDPHISRMELESYVGVPLLDAQREVQGILSVIDRKPIDNPDLVLAALKIFAARAELEMERMRIQKAVKTQARMLDQIGQAIFCFSLEGQCKSWNLHAEKLFGYSLEEILGKSIDCILPKDFTNETLDNLVQQLIIKEELFQEMLMLKKEGSQFDAHLSLTLEKSEAGEITGIIACCRDITERKRIESQRLEAEQRLKFHIQKAPLAFIEWDLDHRVIAWNDMAEKIFGYPAEEIIGEPYTKLVETSFVEECQVIFKKLKEGTGADRSTNRNVRKDGSIIICEWYNTRILNDAGEVIGFASMADDVTERVANEKALQASQQEAARANRSKDEFLAVMSHEIRTPMNSIIGFADLLKESDIDAGQRENLDIIKANAYNLLDLINNVLNFSKLDSGRVQLQYRDLDLRVLALEVEEAMTAEAAQKGLHFSVELDPDLPHYVRTAYLELRQVLLSIVGNAIKFTEKGDITLAMTATPNHEEADNSRWDLLISVQDTGIGISEKDIKGIFTTFQQADSSSTRRFGGTGLGLAICQKICNILNGKLWVRSQPGKGSTFYIQLTCEAVPDSTLSTSPIPHAEEPDSLADYATTYPLRILIADDEEETCRLIGDMLSQCGFEYDVAHDGLECIEKLQSAHFDLIFMDVTMPSVDGIETTQLIRQEQAGEHHKDIFICAITAYADGDDRQRCMDAGMDEHVGKPLLMKSLLKVIRKAATGRMRP